MFRIARYVVIALAFAVSVGSGSAIAQQTKLKWAHVYETSEPYHKWSVWAAGEIEKRTAGKYHIDVFPASTLGKELDLKGAFRWGIEFDWAVDYLSSRRVDVRPLLSGQFPLQDAVKAFELAKDKTRSTKVQVIAA